MSAGWLVLLLLLLLRDPNPQPPSFFSLYSVRGLQSPKSSSQVLLPSPGSHSNMESIEDIEDLTADDSGGGPSSAHLAPIVPIKTFKTWKEKRPKKPKVATKEDQDQDQDQNEEDGAGDEEIMAKVREWRSGDSMAGGGLGAMCFFPLFQYYYYGMIAESFSRSWVQSLIKI